MLLTLTLDELDLLKRFQRNASERSSYVKVTTIILLAKGLSPAEVADYLGIDSSTAYRYLNSYKLDGLDKYLSTDYKGYWVGPPMRTFEFTPNSRVT